MAIACPLFTLSLKKFSPFHLHQRSAVAPQVANHLMRQLTSYSHGQPCELTLPSAMSLSCFYGCGILDVLDAMQVLKEHHFEYRLDGIDGPISVWDPKGHKRSLHHHIHWPTHF